MKATLTASLHDCLSSERLPYGLSELAFAQLITDSQGVLEQTVNGVAKRLHMAAQKFLNSASQAPYDWKKYYDIELSLEVGDLVGTAALAEDRHQPGNVAETVGMVEEGVQQPIAGGHLEWTSTRKVINAKELANNLLQVLTPAVRAQAALQLRDACKGSQTLLADEKHAAITSHLVSPSCPFTRRFANHCAETVVGSGTPSAISGLAFQKEAALAVEKEIKKELPWQSVASGKAGGGQKNLLSRCVQTFAGLRLQTQLTVIYMLGAAFVAAYLLGTAFFSVSFVSSTFISNSRQHLFDQFTNNSQLELQKASDIMDQQFRTGAEALLIPAIVSIFDTWDGHSNQPPTPYPDSSHATLKPPTSRHPSNMCNLSNVGEAAIRGCSKIGNGPSLALISTGASSVYLPGFLLDGSNAQTLMAANADVVNKTSAIDSVVAPAWAHLANFVDVFVAVGGAYADGQGYGHVFRQYPGAVGSLETNAIGVRTYDAPTRGWFQFEARCACPLSSPYCWSQVMRSQPSLSIFTASLTSMCAPILSLVYVLIKLH